MTSRENKRLGELMIVAIVVAFGIVVWWIAANEAAAYERVTGKHVATWDALFLDLRVQEPAK